MKKCHCILRAIPWEFWDKVFSLKIWGHFIQQCRNPGKYCIVFFMQTMTPKLHFEINWPLARARILWEFSTFRLWILCQADKIITRVSALLQGWAICKKLQFFQRKFIPVHFTQRFLYFCVTDIKNESMNTIFLLFTHRFLHGNTFEGVGLEKV